LFRRRIPRRPRRKGSLEKSGTLIVTESETPERIAGGFAGGIGHFK
jgi:hypothetical protein